MRYLLILSILCLVAGGALGQSVTKTVLTPAQQSAVEAQARQFLTWGRDPELIRAVKDQNAKKLTVDQIQKADADWTAGKSDARIWELMGNPCAQRLRALMKSQSSLVEAFVMDNQGALVCSNKQTSDYWQGDEAKWQKSYNGGKGQIFIDQPRYDMSTRTVQVQVSVPVKDGEATIGALTVGLDPAKL
jgi:hypothetical protein